jgi:hypothetical protein
MPSSRPRSKPLRCFCERKTQLARYGVDPRGRLYVHVKVYKGGRIFGEVVAKGDVKIRCRDCFRWHEIIVRQSGRPTLVEMEEQPEEVVVPPRPGA